MKLYLIYEGKDIFGNKVCNLKNRCDIEVDIPNSWLDDECEKLLNLFVQEYTSMDSQEQLDASSLQAKCGGILIKNEERIGTHFHEHFNIYILHKEVKFISRDPKDQKLCAHYGCRKNFNEKYNHDLACHYHLGGPIFHGIEMFWRCCIDKVAYDWESFQHITTCQIGKHSTIYKRFEFPKEIITNQPLTQAQHQAIS
ncbi:unnamed protein product [Phytomonas sp. Hart1]|nr:unnamed protein product [Phytomonas sp. Hart1]|eukprot:CCW66355.1 unnamed protein product [Phytomonas sp. isolate Hart1]